MPKIYKNYYDIVILPSKEVRDYSIKLSKELNKYGSTLILGKESFIPHLSLFHIPVKPENFNNFVNNLEKTVKGLKIGRLKINDLLLWEPHSSVLLMTDKPEWIKKLYLKIIKDNLKYFDWDYDIETLWGFNKLPKLCQKNIKKYGTPLFGRYFMPHITLGVFNNRNDIDNAFSKIKLKKLNFEPKSIYICQLGKNHSCQKILREIKL